MVASVQEIIKKGKRKTTEEMRDNTVNEVTTLEANFRKILGIARKTSNKLLISTA